MKSIFSSLFIFAVLFFHGADYSVAEPPLEEDFDDVSPPTLPSEWSSQSLVGSQQAVTSTTQNWSWPNSVLLSDPASSSDTALLSPQYTISAGAPTFKLMVEFYHRRGMEAFFDGGVLEISLNGAPFVDVTSGDIGGSFSSGGYTHSSLSSGSALAGRAAWSGGSATFEDVVLDIPSLQSGVPFRFRFRLATDNSVGSSGWYIDGFKLTPAIDVHAEVTANRSEVKVGDRIEYTIRVQNPSSIPAKVFGINVSSPTGDKIGSIALDSGGVYSLGSWIKSIMFMFPIEPFGEVEYMVPVTIINSGRSGAVMSIDQASDANFIGVASGMSFLSGSAALPPDGLVNKTLFFVIGSDLCVTPPGSPPAAFIDSVALAQSGPCPVGQSALVAQQGGAAAFIRLPASPPPSPTPWPSTYVQEPPTSGLTIPTFIVDFVSLAQMAPILSAPAGTTKVTLRGKSNPVRSTLPLNVSVMAESDPDLSDNIMSSVLEIIQDQDNDGTGDDLDGCPSDPAKTNPQVCGCGAADADGNSNGILDCLSNQDLRAEVGKLDQLIKSLKRSRFQKQKALRSQIKSQQTLVTTRASGPGISASGPDVNLPVLAQKLDKSVRRLIKSPKRFAANRKSAVKALKTLLTGVGA